MEELQALLVKIITRILRLFTRLGFLIEEQGMSFLEQLSLTAKSLLKTLPAELMDAHDVSPIVNSARYDGPECIQPISDDEIPRAGQLSLL